MCGFPVHSYGQNTISLWFDNSVQEGDVYNSTRCSVPEITSLLQETINRMRNLHQIILQKYGLEAQCLFRDWERLWLRESGYKNQRIFTLRCLHKDLVSVSIKLKSTLKTERAKKIVSKVEKDLTQARIKAINSILDKVSKQTRAM